MPHENAERRGRSDSEARSGPTVYEELRVLVRRPVGALAGCVRISNLLPGP
jgi:hypothetical protein